MIRSILVTSFFLLGTALSASAGTIVGAVSVSTNMGEAEPAVQAIDQSGLSPKYTSGVDDFGTYLAGNPRHQSFFGLDWVSDVNITTGYIEFDLGGSTVVDAIAVWNQSTAVTAAVTAFDLYADGSLLGSFGLTAATSGSGSGSLAQVINFAPVSAQLFRMQITANNGGNQTSLGEVAFSSLPVPEPTGAVLFGAGLFVMHGSFRRKQRT